MPSEIRSHDSFGIKLDDGRGRLPPCPRAEGVHVRLPGEQELQKADAPVAAGLVEAKQHKIVFQPGLPQPPWVILAVIGELSDAVLGQIIVPTYSIVLDEGEEFFAILEHTSPQSFRRLRLNHLTCHRIKVPVDVPLVPDEVATLEAVLVDVRDDGTQERPEGTGN